MSNTKTATARTARATTAKAAPANAAVLEERTQYASLCALFETAREKEAPGEAPCPLTGAMDYQLLAAIARAQGLSWNQATETVCIMSKRFRVKNPKSSRFGEEAISLYLAVLPKERGHFDLDIRKEDEEIPF